MKFIPEPAFLFHISKRREKKHDRRYLEYPKTAELVSELCETAKFKYRKGSFFEPIDDKILPYKELSVNFLINASSVEGISPSEFGIKKMTRRRAFALGFVILRAARERLLLTEEFSSAEIELGFYKYRSPSKLSYWSNEYVIYAYFDNPDYEKEKEN